MDLITETFINFKHKVMARVTEGVMFTYFVGACLIQHKNPTTPSMKLLGVPSIMKIVYEMIFIWIIIWESVRVCV